MFEKMWKSEERETKPDEVSEGQGVAALIVYHKRRQELIPVVNSTGSGGYRGLVVGKAGEETASKVESC